MPPQQELIDEADLHTKQPKTSLSNIHMLQDTVFACILI